LVGLEFDYLPFEEFFFGRLILDFGVFRGLSGTEDRVIFSEYIHTALLPLL
jgi:hypothetical protein